MLRCKALLSFVITCVLCGQAHAELPPTAPSFMTDAAVTPAANPAISDLQLQGITKTLMAYPTQTPEILQNYVGIDTSKIDFDQFMTIINRQNYNEIYNEVSVLSANREAFNNGTFSNVSYYKITTPDLTPMTMDTVVTGAIDPAAQATTTHTTVAAADTAAQPASGMERFGTFLADSPTVAAVVGVAAAGGLIAVAGSGGGSSSNDTAANTPTNVIFNRQTIPDIDDPNDFVDSEFSAYRLNALASNKAQYAWAKGLTGAGVKIGFHDFFADDASANTELSSRIDAQDRHLNVFADSAYTSTSQACIDYPNMIEACNHGVAVMQYAAAARNGAGYLGIAYEANLAMNSVNSTTTFATVLADDGADIVNFSCGGCVSSAELDYLADAGVFMTAATGNDDDNNGGAEPDPSSPATVASDYNYRLIGVTGVEDVGGVLTNRYDHCGSQMQYCMTAYSDIGTSFAAPQVAGAAALLKQGWSFLTASQIGQILLATAQDIGAPGVDAVYGHGLLDIQSAVSPLGYVSFLSGHGTSTGYTHSVISQNQATPFGNAFRNSGNTQGNLVVVDSFGRDFAVKTQDSIQLAKQYKFTSDTMPSFGRQKAERTTHINDALSLHFSEAPGTNGVQNMASYAEYDINPDTHYKLGFATDVNAAVVNDQQKFNTANFISQNAFQNGFVNMSNNDQVFHQAIEMEPYSDVKMKVSTLYSKDSKWDYFQPTNAAFNSDFASSLIDTTVTPYTDLDITFKNGVTHEFNSVLGTQSSGAFDMGRGADTYFTGLNVSYDITPQWNLYGAYLVGSTTTKPAAGSAYSSISDIVSDSFALTATRNNVLGHDSLSFSVGQPTRVRSGSATGLTQTVDRTTGTATAASFTQNLVPTGRTLQLQAAYQKGLSDDMDMNLAVEYESQPYQQSEADADLSALMKFVYRLN